MGTLLESTKATMQKAADFNAAPVRFQCIWLALVLHNAISGRSGSLMSLSSVVRKGAGEEEKGYSWGVM